MKTTDENGSHENAFPNKGSQKYGLLCIDGGGARGVIAAEIIRILEEKLNKTPPKQSKRKFHELFDLAGGCSTGGILMLSSMLRGTSGEDLVKLYKNLAEVVFPRKMFPGLYSTIRLEELLKEHFGYLAMQPCTDSPKVFVVTKRGRETLPCLLQNYEPHGDLNGECGWKCFKAALATSAAPTYFEPVMHNSIDYTDGGVGFNNPIQLLVSEALQLLISDNHMTDPIKSIAYIVSIGTGDMPPLETLRKPIHRVHVILLGLCIPPVAIAIRFLSLLSSFFAVSSPIVAWALYRMEFIEHLIGLKRSVDLTVEQVTETRHAHVQWQIICKKLNIPYFRFNPMLDGQYDLSDTKNIQKWIETTKTYMEDSPTVENVDELCRLFRQR
ncbi:unnamed protein product [Adineta steineri]|uniref:PNPLA domain-containing protein n=1 Tax=Adineta steineri TaxID=433720 RepID=A0A819JXN9_9BILA|nr:unnamed protein product [Adineta steineri]CAF1378288.1 unnamed protein product [Adineta steineri]CAF3793976.1 unnamed protein product [Adineta steineri]CAF3936771.1 unnamed protein product [Adineta steineri]